MKHNLHKPFCLADQPAPCPGYFVKDSLPCVCGATGTVLQALNQVAIPVVPLSVHIPQPVMYLRLSA